MSDFLDARAWQQEPGVFLNHQFRVYGFTTCFVTPSLPARWSDTLRAYADEHATHVVKKGRGPGSLEEEETAGLDYRVVDGNAIVSGLPWLYQWYASHVVGLVARAMGMAITIESLPQAVNINLVSGVGGRYERHVDSTHSALLFASSLEDADGGALELAPPGKGVVRITPKAGLLVIFDGATTPHAVLPLTRERTRYSVPMAFRSSQLGARDPHLSSYLYRPSDG